MLMVSCDLPLLQPEDLRHLSSAASAVTLAPDRARQGTNGLCLPTAEPFDFSFGPGSFERHVERVRRLDLACAIVDRAGLAFDIDTPEHLAQFNALQRRGPQPSPAIGG
jgi:2-phospho-L-lactate guanylyltransferase